MKTNLFALVLAVVIILVGLPISAYAATPTPREIDDIIGSYYPYADTPAGRINFFYRTYENGSNLFPHDYHIYAWCESNIPYEFVFSNNHTEDVKKDTVHILQKVMLAIYQDVKTLVPGKKIRCSFVTSTSKDSGAQFMSWYNYSGDIIGQKNDQCQVSGFTWYNGILENYDFTIYYENINAESFNPEPIRIGETAPTSTSTPTPTPNSTQSTTSTPAPTPIPTPFPTKRPKTIPDGYITGTIKSQKGYQLSDGTVIYDIEYTNGWASHICLFN